jgi:ABC-type uncharacterized transport system permease subunit
LAFVPIISAFVLNVLLYDVSYLYSALMVAQVFFYMLALRGKSYQYKKRTPVYYALPYYFTLLNVACMHAFWRFMKGEKQVIWKPRAG